MMSSSALGLRRAAPLQCPLRAKASSLPASFFSSSVEIFSRRSRAVNPFLLVRMESFWSCGSVDKNRAMVKNLQNYGVIKSNKVVEVMEKIDRGLFVQSGTPAYIDSPMQIGYNATISAPHMHATCLELLVDHLQPGMRVLDVGSGTGYLTACFAMMVGPQGRAVGVEHILELVAFSIENINKSVASALLKEGSLSVHVSDSTFFTNECGGDASMIDRCFMPTRFTADGQDMIIHSSNGRLGWADLAPYDAIHVGAAASKIPELLISQLKPGGRMVIPVGTVFQDLKVVNKKLDGYVNIWSETSVRYVPLTSKDAQLRS